MNLNEAIERAKESAGNAARWEQKPATVILMLNDGTTFTYNDVSLPGVISILRLLGTP